MNEWIVGQYEGEPKHAFIGELIVTSGFDTETGERRLVARYMCPAIRSPAYSIGKWLGIAIRAEDLLHAQFDRPYGISEMPKPRPESE